MCTFYFYRGPPREGANIAGLFMEGARWDTGTGGIVESRIKELFPVMPVIYIKAITQVWFLDLDYYNKQFKNFNLILYTLAAIYEVCGVT